MKNKKIKLNYLCEICKEVIWIEDCIIIEGRPLHFKCYKNEILQKQQDKIVEKINDYFKNNSPKQGEEHEFPIPKELRGYVKPFIGSTKSYKIICEKSLKEILSTIQNESQRKKDEDMLGELSGDTKQKQGRINNEQNACGSGNHADTQVPKTENKLKEKKK